MTTIEMVSIIRKRGQPTRYILMVDDEPVTIQYKVPKTVQTKTCTYNVVHTPSPSVHFITKQGIIDSNKVIGWKV